MATVPLSGTNIRLMSGVPFSNDYKHTRWFATGTEQTNYFMNKPTIHAMQQANFQRIEGKHFIAVNKSIDELWGTNYLMFQNAQYHSRWFYGFVTKLEYVQKNTTYVHFQIDVLQTWRFEIIFKPSYVIREHTRLWNSDGSPIVNTVEEGLNYGAEYDNVSVIKHKENNGCLYLVIVTKQPIEQGASSGIEGGVFGTPQPLSYYFVPFKDGESLTKLFLGGNEFALSPPMAVLKGLYKSEIATNNIVSLYVTESIGLLGDFTVNTATPDILTVSNDHNQNISVVVVADNIALNLIKVNKLKDFTWKATNLGDKYDGFRTVKESKLLMYPYCVTIMDDFKGNRIELRNEHINNKYLTVTQKGSLGTSNHVSYSVEYYNKSSPTNGVEISNEHALINGNPSDIPIINDMLTAFLQGNKNSIQNQRNSVMVNGVFDVMGSTISRVAASGNPLGMASAGAGMVQGLANTALQLEGIQAKQNDIANMPPQIAKMGTNTSYDYGNGYQGVYIIKKQIKPEYQKKLEDYFNMFGYRMNEVKIPSFKSRKYWNYVQTLSCTILGNFNNEDLQELKSVFDNGITLWHTDDIGNYALDNEVI